MNSFGEFLYELRKEKGMTQADLAENLGVTNKAVSKWETGEAMPETALLLPISRIFDVSVDELLAGRRTETEGEGAAEDKTERIEGHLLTRDKNGSSGTRADKIGGLVCALLMSIGVIIYLCVGVFTNLWHPCWLVVTLCALTCGITGSICDACNAEKRKRKLARGENPYTGCACAVIVLICVSVYLVAGVLTNLWHPLWIIVVCGALVDAVIGAIGAIVVRK